MTDGPTNGCWMATDDDPIGFCGFHGCYVDRCPVVDPKAMERAREVACEDCNELTNAGPCPGCGKVVCQLCAECEGSFCRCPVEEP